MNGKSFVERRLDLDGEPLLIRFEAPAEVPGSDFECRWSIAWPDGDVRHRTFGIDGIQALALAMQAVHDRLLESEAYKAGRLTFLGQGDLDLPPSWTTGPLYQIPPPPGGKRPGEAG